MAAALGGRQAAAPAERGRAVALASPMADEVDIRDGDLVLVSRGTTYSAPAPNRD
jgi:hypothetical protein